MFRTPTARTRASHLSTAALLLASMLTVATMSIAHAAPAHPTASAPIPSSGCTAPTPAPGLTHLTYNSPNGSGPYLRDIPKVAAAGRPTPVVSTSAGST